MLNPRLYRIDGKRRLAVAERKQVDFEVTLLPWLSTKILLIRHKKAAYTRMFFAA